MRVARDSHLRRALLAYLSFSSVEWAIWIVVLVWAHGIGDASTVGLATDPAAQLGVEHLAHARRRETLGEP